MPLNGLNIIVTGGARGIGYGITHQLAKLGAHVIVADKHVKKCDLDVLRKKKLKISGYEVDITDPLAVEQLVTFVGSLQGSLHALVNNAGIYSSLKPTAFEDLRVDEFTRVLEVNVTGIFICCKAVLPLMYEAGRGRIINIASAVAFKGNPFMAHYVASKGAVISLTRAMAREFGAKNILVNSVAPGFTLTEAVRQNEALLTGVKEPSLQTRVLKKDMTPQDVAGAVCFFCLPESGFVTGQTLVVDGGAYFN
jgi:NAD(P)-dependent dehydrogenase (short-subunit alcohol dehydrogenase family)